MLFFCAILGVRLRGAQTCRGYRVAAVGLNVGRGFTPADCRKVTLPLKQSLRLAGSPPPFTRTPKTRLHSFRGTPCTREALLRFTKTRRGALCASVFEGKVTSPIESHKGSFVDPRARHGFCIGSLRLIAIIR